MRYQDDELVQKPETNMKVEKVLLSVESIIIEVHCTCTFTTVTVLYIVLYI